MYRCICVYIWSPPVIHLCVCSSADAPGHLGSAHLLESKNTVNTSAFSYMSATCHFNSKKVHEYLLGP